MDIWKNSAKPVQLTSTWPPVALYPLGFGAGNPV